MDFRATARSRHLAGPLAALVACLWSCAASAAPAAAQAPRLPAATAAGAPLPSLPLADALVRSAFVALDRRDFAQVERLLAPLLDEGRPLDTWTRGQALRCRGLAASVAGRYADAATALAAAEEAFTAIGAEPQLAMTWRHRAQAALQSGDRPLARDLAQRALAVFEARHDTEGIVSTLAVLAGLLERGEGAAEALERALRLAEQDGLQGQYAHLLHMEGDGRFGDGDFAGAARTYERAEAIYADLGDDEGLGRVWTSLGRLNRAHGRHHEALTYFQRARDALERAGDQMGVIQAVNATATTLDNLDRQEEAGREYERALALAERSGAARVVNFQRGNLGGHYLGQGQYGRAIPLLRESAAHESSPTIRAIRLAQLGRALDDDGQHEAAIPVLTEAVTSLRDLKNRERLFGVLADRAGAYRGLGRRDEALADVRASLEILEEVRRQLAPGDFLRRGFHQYTQSYASLGIQILMETGRAREALETAERARARAFLDLLAARPALAATPPADGASSVLPASTGPVGAPGEALLLTRDRQEPGHTPAAATAGTVEPARVATYDEILAEARARRSPILSYWVDAERTYVWMIRPDGSERHASVEVADRELVALIRALWTGLPQSGTTALDATLTQRARARGQPAAVGSGAIPGANAPLSPRRAARELYRLLIAPVATALPKDGATLTVIPHGPLFRLSFAALLDDADRYLVERYAVAYGPSVSVLSFTRDVARRQSAGADRYLFVADPAPLPAAPGDPESLPPLPGTLDEVRRIASRLPTASSTTLTGRQAVEPAVTRALAEATVVHLATHGIVRDDDPFGSFLALGADGIGAPHDGALTAEEIYGLRLQARLVVLSACRSGLGEVSADGIVGLTRAFFFAGAPSVVATLWDVADGPSAHLLRDFYAARAAGQNVARALRAAQLGMLAGLRAGRVTEGGASGARLPERPVFWAAFVLVGEP